MNRAQNKDVFRKCRTSRTIYKLFILCKGDLSHNALEINAMDKIQHLQLQCVSPCLKASRRKHVVLFLYNNSHVHLDEWYEHANKVNVYPCDRYMPLNPKHWETPCKKQHVCILVTETMVWYQNWEIVLLFIQESWSFIMFGRLSLNHTQPECKRPN